jgi:hypothetical protein
MPAKTDKPKRSCPLSVDDDMIAFIERAGVGKNFSEKTRSIVNRVRESYDVLAVYEGVVLKHNAPNAVKVYEQNAEGEKIWGEFPFEFNKKLGWKSIEGIANKNGFVAQIIEVQDEGFITVWVAPNKAIKDCASCKAKLSAVINEM